jgi:type VI secretion system secreted protein Hcp
MPGSWFLKIDGIPGESLAAAHKDEIDVLSWSWGVTGRTSPGGGGGGGAGKASFDDFHFVAAVSKASPALFLACATGTHIKSAALSGNRGSGKAKLSEFLRYKLADVQVNSLQQASGEGGPVTDQFSLSYSKVEISYTPQSATGGAQPPVQAGFDVKLNKKV